MDSNSGKILIVDDALFNIKIVTNILEHAGYEIHSVNSGIRAIIELRNNKYDLILLDVVMPEMDGYEVNKVLKQNKNTKDIPIIFLTARGDSNSVVKALDDGAVDFITKPFNEKELLSRIRIQLELRRTRKKLEETNATKDKFFSIIGHDLKNPIGAIRGLAEELVQNIDQFDIDEVNDFSIRILKNSEKVCQLLEDILQWSRLQGNKIEYKPSALNLAEVIDTSVTLLSLNAKKKNINIKMLIKEDIKVFADYNMLNTVIRNLISNAIKFTYENGEIIVSAYNDGELILISVEDNGVGMQQENIEKLFNIGSNFSTKGTQKEEGTGLGLILCKEFVERNGGSIFVESEYGKGSCFSFTVPQYMVTQDE